MQIEKYKGVIRRVLVKYAGQSPELITEKLIESIEIAQEIAGDVEIMSTPQRINFPSVLIETSRSDIQAATGTPARGPVLISSAPPVAGAGDSADDDDVDHWESQPGKGDGARRLEQHLNSVLPLSITLGIHGIEDPLTLVRGVGSPGMKFVHVSYTLPGDTVGPRCTIMTSQKTVNPDAIIEDIKTQAGASYSKEKRTITPRALPPQSPPTSSELQQMLDRDRRSQSHNDGLSGDEAALAREDADSWTQNRSPRWK